MSRHYYLDHLGRIKPRRGIDWRYVAKIVGAIVVGQIIGVGLTLLMFRVVGDKP